MVNPREILAHLFEIMRSDAVIRAAIVLLPYAGVLIGLDVAAHYGSLTQAELPVQFYLASDRSFGEFLEYSLTAAIAIMTLLLWRKQGASLYLANCLLFAWLTIDNWIEVHETFGQNMGSIVVLPEALPIEPAHLAEAFIMVCIGAIWLASLAFGLRNASGRTVTFSLLLTACVVGAALFGVVVDLMVVWGEQEAVFHAALTFVEDAGEFVMIILAFFVTVGFFDQEYRRREDASTRSI